MSTQEEILIKQQSECMAKQAMQIEVLTELLDEATKRASMNLENSRRWKLMYEEQMKNNKQAKELL